MKSAPKASAGAEQQYVEPESPSYSSFSANTEAGKRRVKRKKSSLPTPSEIAKAEPSPQPVSTGSTLWGFSIQKLTGWRRQS